MHNFEFQRPPPPEKMPFESKVGKEENTDNMHFLLSPTMFSNHSRTNSICNHIYFVVSKCFQFEPVIILSFDKGLRNYMAKIDVVG